MLFYPKLAKPRFIQFNEEGIQGRLSLRKTISLNWASIASIEARTFMFLIHTKDGRAVTIDLGSISYRQHKIVKPKFIDVARSKGIPVTTGQTLHEP